jgi:rod shape-determining protein MreC
VSVELSEKIGKLSTVYVVRNLKKSEVQKIDDTLKAQIKKDGQ